MPSATAYGSVARAIAAARRLANRTGKPVKVLLRNPLGLSQRPSYVTPREWKLVQLREAAGRRWRLIEGPIWKRSQKSGPEAHAAYRKREEAYARRARSWSQRKRNPARPDYSAVPWMVKQRERLAVDAAADARSRWKEAEALHGEGSKKERGAWRDYSAISRKILKTAGAISAQKRAYGSETLDALIAARGQGRRHARVGRNPRRKPYPHKLASKYIRQEIRAGRKGAQAVAIGIARARRAKRNPYKLKGTFTGRATEEKPRGGGKPHAPRAIPFEQRRPTIGGLHKNPLRKPGDVGSFKLEEFGPTVHGQHVGWSSASESIARVKLLRGTRGYKKGAVLFVPRWKLEEGR